MFHGPVARSRIRAVLARTAPVLLALSVLAVVAPPSAHAIDGTAPAGFSTVAYDTTLGQYALTNFVFLPNGTSMIAIGKCGYLVRVNLSADGSAANVTSMGQLPNPSPGMGPGVYCQSDRGLVGIDLASDYPVTGNFYLLFDYCKGAPGGPSVCDAPGKPTGKLSRFTVNNINAPTGLVPNSEKVVLDDLPSYSANPEARCDGSHTVGTVIVATDGTLYVGNGEGSNYCDPDWSALGAQDITSPRGKIFHINADGTGVNSNPFYNQADASSWQSRVFAYGFRNPFRFAIQPGTSNLMVGEVGWNTTEELDLVQNGKNYGWPCWEGNDRTSGYTELDTCKALYANGGDQKPLYTWPHAGSGSAAVGGAFYTGGDYPASYDGTFFFADYAKQWLATRSAGGTVAMFGSGDWGAEVAIHTGPNGDIFFANLLDSTIVRLRYTPVPNQFPTAHAHASVTVGQAPLAVSFTSTGSFDPDGTIQSYQWDFGDGSPVVNGATASHTYSSAGVFTAKLTVRDNANASSVDTVSIATNNSPPVLTVAPLPAGVTYAVGDTVAVTATATDPDGGPAPTITYQQVLHHCPFPGSCHLHPGGAAGAPAGGSFTCVIDDHGDDTYLEVVVTALDSGGATTTASVVVPARKHTLSVSSSPGGVPIDVDSSNSISTPSLTEVVGSKNLVTAPQSYGNLVFDHWSDGGARSHTLTMPDADLNLVAFYKVAPVAPVPPPSAGGWTLNGSAVMDGASLILTPNAGNKAGSAVWPQTVATAGLRASFDATIDQGTGADGLTFALLDPSASANALGAPSAGLGFGTLPGVAVALDTFKGPVDPSSNFVGITNAGSEGQLVYVATTGAVPPLRNATHHVDVVVLGGHVKVSIDGAPVLDQAVAVPNQALLAFTAGTGGLTDRHMITNVAIQPPAPSLAVTPTSVDFGAVPVGQSASQPVTITNVGTAPLTVQELTAVGGPFAMSGPVGAVLGAGQSVGASVTMTPPAGGVWKGSATVATSAGDATVLVSGSAPGGSAFVVADSVFTPVQPYRLLDTREPALSPGGQAAPLQGGQELALSVAGQPGAPPQPSAAMLNVTVTDPVAAGFVRAYPCGSTPANSTVNFGPGQTAANLATVRIPADGRICFWSMVDTNLVIDVAGWYSPPGNGGAGVAYQTVEPVRVLDSRRAELAPAGAAAKFAAGQEVVFDLAGRSGFPADARAALLNLTVTEPDEPGYLRVYPCGEEQDVSNVNFVAGQTVANLAAVKVAAGGQVCFRASASAHVVVDLAGWYAPGPGAVLATPDPGRVLDTRAPDLAPGGVAQPLAGGAELALQVTGYDSVPAGASSVVLNITATNTAADGYVAAYPCGTAPLVSNVNYRAGQVAAANLAVVKLAPDGRVCFTSFATTDLVIDLAGWYVG